MRALHAYKPSNPALPIALVSTLLDESDKHYRSRVLFGYGKDIDDLQFRLVRDGTKGTSGWITFAEHTDALAALQYVEYVGQRFQYLENHDTIGFDLWKDLYVRYCPATLGGGNRESEA
jgi:hypothetical protein